MTTPRAILHVDMDAFFASVEQRDNPLLRGLPVLVGGSSGRGVVTAASYEARRFGCRSAMPMAQALRLCPNASVVKGRHSVYSQVSQQVMAILHTISPDVQPVSIDEAYVDLTGVLRQFGFNPAASVGLDGQMLERDMFAAAERAGSSIRALVRQQTALACSVGISGSKLIAKIASDLCKPNGLRVVLPADVTEVLAPLSVSVLRGVGPAMAARLAAINIRTIAELRKLTTDELAAALGFASADHAASLLAMAQGLDDRAVHTGEAAKSIAQERTFAKDIGDLAELEAVLLAELEHVLARLRQDQRLCRTITLKLRTSDFATITRSATLGSPSATVDTIWPVALQILHDWAKASSLSTGPRRAAPSRVPPLRLLGISLHNFVSETQLDLFGQAQSQRAQRVDLVMDAITAKFGRGSISRARSSSAIIRKTDRKPGE